MQKNSLQNLNPCHFGARYFHTHGILKIMFYIKTEQK